LVLFIRFAVECSSGMAWNPYPECCGIVIRNGGEYTPTYHSLGDCCDIAYAKPLMIKVSFGIWNKDWCPRSEWYDK